MSESSTSCSLTGPFSDSSESMVSVSDGKNETTGQTEVPNHQKDDASLPEPKSADMGMLQSEASVPNLSCPRSSTRSRSLSRIRSRARNFSSSSGHSEVQSDGPSGTSGRTKSVNEK